MTSVGADMVFMSSTSRTCIESRMEVDVSWPRYILVRRDRVDKGGGGVILLHPSMLNVKEIK